MKRESNIRKGTLLLALLWVVLVPLYAQWYNVRGTVYEHATLKPLPGANVQVNDSTGRLVAGRQTVDNGQFMIPGVPVGRYQLKVSFMGFKPQTFALDLRGKGGNKKVQDVLLKEDAILMQEAVVEGNLPEMTVADDTVVYHASAFSLPPGAMVEELIKKLPGVVVDDNGKITHNGKEVKKILVDGKEFFNNNQELVLKNIPAEIVDKVKAYDKQSDLARVTGIDDGEEQTVLDLEIKKDKRRGWFGQVSAGYGTEERYQARMNLNRFLDKQKASIVGNANNTQGSGMQENQDAAASLNLEWDKLELNGGLTGRFHQTSGSSWSNSQNFEKSKAAYSNSTRSNGSHSNVFETNWKVEWEPDSMTDIILRPRFSINGNRNHSNSESATYSSDPYAVVVNPLEQLVALRSIGVNHRVGGNVAATDQLSASMSAQINRKLAKKGRNITFQVSGGYNDQEGTSSSYSQIDYYQFLAYTGADSIYHKVQYDDTYNKGKNFSTRISYSEPIGTGHYLQFSYNYSYRYSDRERSVASIFDPLVEVYQLNPSHYEGFQQWASRDTAQSGYTENVYQNHDIRLQYRFIDSKVRLNIGLNVQPQVNQVDYMKGAKQYDLQRTVVNWSPTLNFRYRYSRQHQVEVRYGGQSGQPAITDLIPDTLSNANPLNIRLGNPGLKPSFTHNLRADWRLAQPDWQRTYNANIDFRFTQNATTSRTEYNEQTGGRVTMPVNINGNWSGRANFHFNTALPDQRFRVSTGLGYNHTTSNGYVYQSSGSGNSAVGETMKNVTHSNNYSQNVRFTYRETYGNENTLELNARGSFSYHSARASATAASDLDTYTFGYGGSANMNFWFGLNLSSDIVQNSRRGYAEAAMNTNQWIWNAQASYSFLSRRQATVSLRWNDILRQRDMVSRTISATARTDSDSDRVTSYVMLSFIYRFNVFGGR